MDNVCVPSPTDRQPIVGLSLVLLAVLAGCASTAQPVVYPVADAKRELRAEAALKACRAKADPAGGINGTRRQQTGTAVARRGAAEFVDKAVESMVNRPKDVSTKARAAGAGGMAGSLTTVVLTWNEPDGVYRNYVDLCLKERGHKVLGWR